MKENKDVGIVLIRIVLAGIFLFAGITKLTHMEMVIGFFGSIGLVPFWAYVASIVETLAGLAVLLGIFIRPATTLLMIIMAVAILSTDISRGFIAHELEIAMLLISMGLFFLGAGKYSLSRKNKMGAAPTPAQ